MLRRPMRPYSKATPPILAIIIAVGGIVNGTISTTVFIDGIPTYSSPPSRSRCLLGQALCGQGWVDLEKVMKPVF